MKLEETGIIMDILETAYPRFYNGPNAPDRIKTLKLWAEMFQDDDVSMVAAAVKAYIAEDTKGYAPHIGAIKNSMYKLRTISEMDAAKAWEQIRKAASRSGYGAQEEFEKLPENLQRMTSPGQLYEWSQMDSDIFNSVIASTFQKAYMRRQEWKRQDALLPTDVKRIVSGLSKRMALEDGSKGAVR